MDDDKFKSAYHEAVEEKLMENISLLMQNWHYELAPQLAKLFVIPEGDAFSLIEREYFRNGYVTIEFVPEDL
jgi:hypothetical protein